MRTYVQDVALSFQNQAPQEMYCAAAAGALLWLSGKTGMEVSGNAAPAMIPRTLLELAG